MRSVLFPRIALNISEVGNVGVNHSILKDFVIKGPKCRVTAHGDALVGGMPSSRDRRDDDDDSVEEVPYTTGIAVPATGLTTLTQFNQVDAHCIMPQKNQCTQPRHST